MVNNVTKIIKAISMCPPSINSPSNVRKRRERLMMILMIDFMLIIFLPASAFSDSTLANNPIKFTEIKYFQFVFHGFQVVRKRLAIMVYANTFLDAF